MTMIPESRIFVTFKMKMGIVISSRIIISPSNAMIKAMTCITLSSTFFRKSRKSAWGTIKKNSATLKT
ncbi:MAG: hypothetical protein ACD_4C00046G0001 [uncultured bacterium (gcode 4)]|uniref:Uncharacterized protein n=1 Tax=uncultured bacterium (gcode 4) TaxID=1234023 RepID=K2FVX2_9BACT|nr:MAG: hypothetical protein ACD_4C00046G0001 [uncultured bacterium (gcode 4)]